MFASLVCASTASTEMLTQLQLHPSRDLLGHFSPTLAATELFECLPLLTQLGGLVLQLCQLRIRNSAHLRAKVLQTPPLVGQVMTCGRYTLQLLGRRLAWMEGARMVHRLPGAQKARGAWAQLVQEQGGQMRPKRTQKEPTELAPTRRPLNQNRRMR